MDAFDWARRAEDLGAGELLVTSIDREGTGTGFDLELTEKIATSVSIPVIAGGGAGSPRHVVEVVEKGRADAVCISSLFHYDAISRIAKADESAFAAEGNVEFLHGQRRAASTRRVNAGIGEVKDELERAGIHTRRIPIPA